MAPAQMSPQLAQLLMLQQMQQRPSYAQPTMQGPSGAGALLPALAMGTAGYAGVRPGAHLLSRLPELFGDKASTTATLPTSLPSLATPTGIGPVAGGDAYGQMLDSGLQSVPTPGVNTPAAGNYVTQGLNALGVGPETSSLLGEDVIPGAAALYGSYDIGKNLLSGRKMGTAGGAIKGATTGAAIGSFAGMPWLGAGVGGLLGGILGQFGHGQNYYDAQDRKSMGKKLGIDPERFAHDPTSYNYDMNSSSRNQDIGASNALTYLLTGADDGTKTFGDLGAELANEHKGGTSAMDLYSRYGLDRNSATQRIQSDSHLTAARKSAYLAGINDSFNSDGAPPAPAPQLVNKIPSGARYVPAKVNPTGQSPKSLLAGWGASSKPGSLLPKVYQPLRLAA